MSEKDDPSDAVFTGACLCGAIRYEARGMPTAVNHCHCAQCQRASGAAMATWACWPRRRVRLLEGSVVDFESSPGVKRSFCPRCGSTMFWRRVATEREELDIAAGTIDQAGRLAPADHIFVKSRQPWMPLCDGLPAYENYRPKQ